MKVLLLLIVVIFSAAAGYLFEPKMRMQLTGKPANFEKPSPMPGPKRVDDGDIPFNPVTPTPNTPTPVNPTPVNPTPTDPGADPTPGVVDVVPPAPPSDPVVPEVTTPETPEAPAQTADVVLVMKASIASGQISKFNASQVLEWEAGTGTETIDGQTYQVGNVKYQAETPFGTKNLPAKALIKDGKVVRWISPKSGMQIE